MKKHTLKSSLSVCMAILMSISYFTTFSFAKNNENEQRDSLGNVIFVTNKESDKKEAKQEDLQLKTISDITDTEVKIENIVIVNFEELQ